MINIFLGSSNHDSNFLRSEIILLPAFSIDSNCTLYWSRILHAFIELSCAPGGECLSFSETKQRIKRKAPCGYQLVIKLYRYIELSS